MLLPRALRNTRASTWAPSTASHGKLQRLTRKRTKHIYEPSSLGLTRVSLLPCASVLSVCCVPLPLQLVGPSAEQLIHTFCVVPRHNLVYDDLLGRCPPEAFNDLQLPTDTTNNGPAGHEGVPPALLRLVPPEGVTVRHIKTGEPLLVDRLTVARFLVMTMADFAEQLFSWQVTWGLVGLGVAVRVRWGDWCVVHGWAGHRVWGVCGAWCGVTRKARGGRVGLGSGDVTCEAWGMKSGAARSGVCVRRGAGAV